MATALLLPALAQADEQPGSDEPAVLLVVTRSEVRLRALGLEEGARVKDVRVRLRCARTADFEGAPWTERSVPSTTKGSWCLSLRGLIPRVPGHTAAFVGVMEVEGADGTQRTLRSPEQVWELGARPRREGRESVTPEFAHPFDQRRGPVDPKTAAAALAHVKPGTRYVYAVRFRNYRTTIIQKVLSVQDGEVRYAQKTLGVGDRPMGRGWGEQTFKAPGVLLEKLPPTRADRLEVPGLGEVECLVWNIRGTEMWCAAVDGKPTYPWLLKIESPRSGARLVRVEPAFR